MGELGDVYRAMNDNKKEARKTRLPKNLKILDNSGIEYTMPTNYHCLVKDYNGKSASFYPSTNKWVDHSNHNKFNGNAASFVIWLNKKGVNY